MIYQLLFHFLLFVGQSLTGGLSDNVFEASRNGNIEALKEMVTIKADTVNAIDSRGYSPLILAAYNKQYAVMKFLIQSNANINYQSPQGDALCAASFKGDTIAAEILLKNGANVNQVDNNGTNAILYAALFNHIRLATILMQFGANPTIADNEGLSAELCAKKLNNKELIELFNAYKDK